MKILAILAMGLSIFGGRWDGRARFTAIDVVGGVEIRSFDPVTGEGFKMKLPHNLEIETVGGRGKWLSAKIGQAGNKSWAADSVADYLGIMYTTTTKSWSELGSWFVMWREVDMVKMGWVRPVQTVDGVEIMKLTQAWETAGRELFISQTVATQGWMIEVVNATGEVGAAARAARRIESSGMRVVKLDNRELIMDDRCEARSRKIVNLLVREWGCKWVEDRSLGEKEIVLTIGKGS